jgi:hypothetical protein
MDLTQKYAYSKPKRCFPRKELHVATSFCPKVFVFVLWVWKPLAEIGWRFLFFRLVFRKTSICIEDDDFFNSGF